MKSTDNNNITIFLSLGNPCVFFLVKEKTWKRIFNTNKELSQNRTEKQIMPSKATITWIFNDVWCCLFIACFDWKIGVFQKTFARVYYILNPFRVQKYPNYPFWVHDGINRSVIHRTLHQSLDPLKPKCYFIFKPTKIFVKPTGKTPIH